MDMFDVFGAPRTNEPAVPRQRDQRSGNGWLFSLWPKSFSLKRHILELKSAHSNLQEQYHALVNEHAALLRRFSEMDSLQSSIKDSLTASQRENADLKNKLGRLEKANAELRSAAENEKSKNRTERPEWAKELNVDDLFAGVKTADEKARRFRELSKIYHPDLLNNPSGLKNLMVHIADTNPQWLRTACYEAYLLIKDKKEMR